MGRRVALGGGDSEKQAEGPQRGQGRQGPGEQGLVQGHGRGNPATQGTWGGRWGVGGVWAEHSEQKKVWEVTSWWWEGARKAGKRHPSGSPNTQGFTSAHVHTQAGARTHTCTISPTEVQVQPWMALWVLFCTPPPIP